MSRESMTVEDDVQRDASLRMLEHEIGVLLRRIRRVMGERAHMVHEDLGATAYLLLGALRESGPQRASALAEVFELDKGAVSRLVHQLMELGLVERKPDPADGRASIVAISRAGERKMTKVNDARRVEFARRMADWRPGELERLSEGLARYNATLAASQGEWSPRP